MKLVARKILTLAVAGCFAWGGAAALVPEFGSVASAHEHYEDGSSNAYSHRAHEEQQRHESTVRAIRHEYRQDGDEKKYQRRMKEEQERHDRAMREIRHDYDSHARHGHH
jgi:hypothetical protein